MIRAYRCYRNRDPKEPDKQVGVQLFKFHSVFEWLVFELHEAVLESCHLFHHLPLPRWLANWQSDWGCDCTKPGTPPLYDDGCACWGRFGDYYGEDWGGLWHCYLETPLMNYLYNRKSKRILETVYIKLPISEWGFIISDPDVNWIRNEIEREKAYPVDEHGDTTAPWHCDYPGETWLYKLMEWATRPWRTPSCGNDTGPKNLPGLPGQSE
jgi:hypothetical protein